jgi:hypothetical protein
VFTSIEGSGVSERSRPHGAREEELAADAWYYALDQETTAVGPQRWRLHVMGIHTTCGTLWIQLQPAPESALSLVLKVGRDTGIEDAVAALRSAELPTSWPLIVDATRASSRVERIPHARPLRRAAPLA